VDELRARVGVRRIRCISTLPPETIATWPEVVDVGVQGGRLQLTTAEAEVVVLRLLQNDDRLRELEVQRAGLAEAFTELTRDAQASSTDQREAA
jgi:ABC-2 type transport system ATP-binding protein